MKPLRHSTVISYAALAVSVGALAAVSTTQAFLPSASLASKSVHRAQPRTVATLASGHSESGMFSAGSSGASGGYIGAGVTYPVPLAHAVLNSHIVNVYSGKTAKCPGPGKAAKGYLCLYYNEINEVDSGYGYSSESYFSTPSVGAVLYWEVKGGGAYVGGEWTVTAS